MGDIVVDLLKLANYLKLEGPRGLFLTEGFFLLNFITWAYLRLYVYPMHCVFNGVWYGSREVITAPTAPQMQGYVKAMGGKANAYTWGHKPGFALADGSFDLLANIRAIPILDTPDHGNLLQGYWTCGALLSTLAVMHVIRYLMFWRILHRMAVASSADLHD